VRATRPDISLVVAAGTVVHVRHDEHASEGDLHLDGHPSAWLLGGLRTQFDHAG
jgi:hypothetical protein